MSKVRVHNEWDSLEEIIVGRATNARIPSPDVGLFAIDYREYGSIENIPSGQYSDPSSKKLKKIWTYSCKHFKNSALLFSVQT